RLLTQVLHRCRSIRVRLSRLRELTYPSETPKRLAGLIEKLTDDIQEEMLNRSSGAVASAEDLAVELKMAVRGLMILGAHLRYIERAATRQTPWSLIRPLEELGQQIHPSTWFIIRPQWNYNYTILELVSLYREVFSKLLGPQTDATLL